MKKLPSKNFLPNERFEYAFSAVPDAKRKDTWRLVLIMIGFAFSFTGLTIGVEIGEGREFVPAVAVCLAGNIILYLMALLWGMLGYKTGYGSARLVKKILGEKPAFLFSLLVILFTIMWIGTNGDFLARVTITILPGWEIPIAPTIVLAVFFCICTSLMGWRGLEIMSVMSVPLIILLTVANTIHVGHMKDGFDFLLDYRPQRPVGFRIAVVTIVGSFCLASITMPDICRFAKSRRAVISCVSAYIVVLTVSNLCGILIVQATEAHNLNYAFFMLEMAFRSLIWVILCSYTTQNVNMYMGSLAIQNLMRKTKLGGNISHRTAITLIGGFSTIVAIADIIPYLLVITSASMFAIMPLTGVVLGEIMTRTKESGRKESISLIAWLSGSAAGVCLWYFGEVKTIFPPMLVGCLCYVLLKYLDIKFWKNRNNV